MVRTGVPLGEALSVPAHRFPVSAVFSEQWIGEQAAGAGVGSCPLSPSGTPRDRDATRSLAPRSGVSLGTGGGVGSMDPGSRAGEAAGKP